jgi:hypothetical protein
MAVLRRRIYAQQDCLRTALIITSLLCQNPFAQTPRYILREADGAGIDFLDV